MSNIVEIIVSILFIVLFFVVSTAYIFSRLRYRKLAAQLHQAEIDREHFKVKLTEQVSMKNNKKLENTDGFIRFISTSRDAAFKYIEDVQAAIAEYDESVGEMVEYYNKTGKLPGNKPSEIMKKFADAHNKLMKELPKDNV